MSTSVISVKAVSVFSRETNVTVSFMKFPGGEEHVKVQGLDGPGSYAYISIKAIITDSAGVMRLMLLVDALRRLGAKTIHLDLPYVPYGRQDRVCNEGEAFSLKVFCNLINSLELDKVTILDPHSDVTPALLNNCKVISSEFILSWIKDEVNFKDRILVSPDAGANKKVHAIAKALSSPGIIRADKLRDVATGNILETVVYSEHLGNKDLLIVDDIMDGGRTFVELGKKLREITTGRIGLYVTHLIASKGTSALDGVIDELYYRVVFDESKLDSKVVNHVRV